MNRILVVPPAGLIILVPSPASARVSAPLCVSGNSAAADPPVLDCLAGETGLPGHPECPRSGSNYGGLAARKPGLPAADFSCSGHDLDGRPVVLRWPRLSRQVELALAAGTLDDATGRVLITTGFNDTHSNGVSVQGRFVDDLIPQVRRIHAAAPNARIQIVGYATMADDNGICLISAGYAAGVDAPVVRGRAGHAAGPPSSPTARRTFLSISTTLATGTSRRSLPAADAPLRPGRVRRQSPRTRARCRWCRPGFTVLAK